MKRSTKAALWSALVFPGLGHFLVRRYLVGALLLCLAGGALYSVTHTALSAVTQLAGEIESGGLAIESTSIGQLVAQRSQQAEQSSRVPMAVLTICWVIGIVDSWRVGRAQDREEDTSAKRTV